MSIIKVSRRRKIYVNGIKLELRIKGDWYWAHWYMPIFAFLTNIFVKGYKKKFMENFITVSKVIRPIIYVTTKRKGISRESLEHEVVHLEQMGSFFKSVGYSWNYILRPKKRFFYELEAYEVQFQAALNKHGQISHTIRIKYARVMSGQMYWKPVTFDFALREVNKLCDKLESECFVNI
jgi:hypothetical protein